MSAKYQGQNGWAESPVGKHKRKNKKEDPPETNEEMIGMLEYWPNSNPAKSEQIFQRRIPFK